jgi:hypothetical protein
MARKIKFRMSLIVVVATVLVVVATTARAADPAAAGKPCAAGYVHAGLSWGHKCLKEGQFCKVAADGEYHRYRFHCHTGGRLSRSAKAGNKTGGGCQPGYSPCLPRVADLNCADIPASKRPVRVTGDDPYRLDGDGDGIACEG